MGTQTNRFAAYGVHFDATLLSATLILVAVGIVMVYSTSGIYASMRFGDELYFLKRQIAFSALGLVGMGIAMRVDYHLLRKFVYPILLLTLGLLLLVLIPGIGHETGGARRWLALGGFTFQPSEFAKISLIVYLSHSMIKKGEKVKDFTKGFVPNMFIAALVIALVVMEPDFGTAISMVAVVFVVLFAAGARLRHILAVVVSFVPLVYFAISTSAYRQRRILAFMDPWSDPDDTGFQIIQSFIAFGTGGIWGKGLGEGRQKLFYLPEAHTDFIYSVIGEELGLIGAAIILIIFGIFVFRGLMISMNSEDKFGAYLGMGLTMIIGLQAFINAGVVTGLLPTKGLTMPFVSYGGTSLVMSLLCAGILLNISTHRTEGGPWQ